MAIPTVVRDPGVVRRINDLIWASLDTGGRTEPTAFFCECIDGDCYRPVWLTPREYEQGRSEPRWTAISEEHGAVPETEAATDLHRTSDYRCSACGYSVARSRPPLRCPICGANRWHLPRQVRLAAAQ